MYGKGLSEMVWMDLSVNNATQIKDFYQKVLNWQSEPISMEDNGDIYTDFVMSSPLTNKKESQAKTIDESSNPQDNTTETASFVTGICHAKGDNADMPSAWLPYFLVDNIELAVDKVEQNGGSLVTKIKMMGTDSYVVIKDPAGALSALYQKG